ncbi:chymotrypsin-C-like [Clupea harengus]|uniref:pancreatic elastase II n=1 Tax=Clupea harengus TaxID=7950 RepID=A0A6P8EYY1_CLUHA|nr:chymotrypsin-C-like [Clupea harengus]
MKVLVLFSALVACAYSYSCGKPAVPPTVSRVVGGQEATPNSWPWQITLQHQMGDVWFPSCGGTLISPDWVLTAAHCINCGGTLISPDWVLTAAHCIKKGYNYRVQLGKHRLSVEQEEGSMTVQVAKIHIHNKYDDHFTRNDIALLWLDHTIELSDEVQPACLPPSGFILPHQASCYVTGWGRLSTNGDGSDSLQQALLPVVEYDICKQPDWWSFLLTDKMVCAGGEGTTGSCMGDSGGPLNCQNSYGIWEVHGIVSFGASSCNQVQRPSVFTRVSAYVSWINAILNQYG